jgi:hypothetical protein
MEIEEAGECAFGGRRWSKEGCSVGTNRVDDDGGSRGRVVCIADDEKLGARASVV